MINDQTCSQGSARTEGYYKISYAEKMEYLSNAKALAVAEKQKINEESELQVSYWRMK